MEQNRVKKILREGGLALGTHVGGIPDPQIVELIGLTGFDAAFCARPASTQPSFCASSNGGAGRASAACAERRGRARGGQDRALSARGRAGHGRRQPRRQFRQDAALGAHGAVEQGVAARLHNRGHEAVEQIEEIAAVDGVDLLAVGPSDLSRSLGVSGGHPDSGSVIFV
jgi:hypothetical protein